MKSRADRVELAREGKLPACPDCDKAALQLVQTDSDTRAGRTDDKEWYCRVCSSRFEDAIWRERRSTTLPNASSLAGKLLEADPDEVSAGD